MDRLLKSVLPLVATVFAVLPGCEAQTVEFTSVPEGYIPGSIMLPEAFTGALAIDPTNDNILYASVGSFQDTKVARIELDSGNARIVANGPFGNIGGIAVLAPDTLAFTNNFQTPGADPDNTILLASDENGDGDFNGEGEIRELIAPILEGGFGFTGVQVHVVPPGNPSNIPTGSLMVQTADGIGESELLVVTDPLITPMYRPVSGPFFAGFDFNGGFDFDSRGRVVMGSATVLDSINFIISGTVSLLDNLNGDEDIDPDEVFLLQSTDELPNGKSDLTIDGEDDVFCPTAGEVVTFRVPGNVKNLGPAPNTFATTTSGFLSAVLVNSKQRPFDPNSGPNGATLIIGSGFGESNLLTLRPQGSADLNQDGGVDSIDLILFQEQWRNGSGSR